ncbi:MAG: transcription-repair coupling factor, partial [Phycisphaerae bacterium]
RGDGDPAGVAAVRSLIDPDDLLIELTKFATLELHTFAPKEDRPDVNLAVRSLQRMEINTAEALDELEQLAGHNRVWVYCENPAEEERFRQLLGQEHPNLNERLETAIGHVNEGFHWPEEKLVVVGHHEIFRRYGKVRRMRRVRAGRPIESMLELQEGDYVVHVGHGIARFEGLRSMEQNGRTEEYLRLRFAQNAVLHVPASRINLVQKYIGTRGHKPTLSRMGGKVWSKQKDRVSEAVKDLAADMLRIQAMRAATKGTSFPIRTEWQRQFADEFIYQETEDQLTALKAMEQDMAAERPMDRLLCGDVGYGKTELAMRAAFRVAEAGRQAAVLVPTTVLADQHYRTFRERFADFPIHVEMLSRFRTGKQQKDILKRLKAKQVDILIGTHRILSKDVKFADLGLVVIDEEQRFGVENKEHLKSLRATVEVLTLTATPIPRTLHMSLLGLKDISSLTTPPMDRRAIHTEVVQYDDELIRMAVNRELSRDGQVFFVHNKVMNIRSVAAKVQDLVPDCRVAYAHGQMKEGKLEEVMLQFIDGRIDVLVCTTIIESGLDIPSANTMIIHEADRFGLAQLHQLRGRVGRYKHRAYCYLLLPERRPVSRVAAKRLKAIEEFSDLGAGFQIAMRDLEIRGAGNILGREQSGHIAVVGYELYCQLLEKAVRKMQGKPPDRRRDAHVEIGIDAYIPRSYIPSERQRMEVYRRLVKCARRDDLKQLKQDLDDAYGKSPSQVDMLLDVAEIRVLLGQMGVHSLIRKDPDLIFSVHDFAAAEKIFENIKGRVTVPDRKTVYYRPPTRYMEMPTLTTILLTRLRQALAETSRSEMTTR